MTTTRTTRPSSDPAPRRAGSRLGAIVLAAALLAGTASIGVAVVHDIERHSSAQAAP